MTPDQLFVESLADLDTRLQLRRGEYDALMMAWLLRKLLLNGERSLIALVSRGREDVPVRFTVQDIDPPATLVGWLPARHSRGRQA